MRFRFKKWMVLLMLPFLCLALAAAAAALWAGGEIAARRSELAEYIRANPDTAAVAVYTVDEKGEMVEDGRAVFRNADAPLVVGSTMKLLVLAAYAGAVDRGELDPAGRVPIAEWERYYLPGTDGGAHAAALSELGLAADTDGFAADPDATVSLGDLARWMIHYSGNAETDYLLDRMGAERVRAAIEAAGMASHEPLRPILGLALLMCNADQPAFLRDGLDAAVAGGGESVRALEAALTARYLGDETWRRQQFRFLAEGGCTKESDVLTWDHQVAAGELFPRGTARDYARLMARIATGTMISPGASRIMQGLLESVPSDGPVTLLFHQRFGAKDGLTAGVLALASYAVPMRGPAAGRTRVAVILLNRMPVDVWQRQAEWQGIYLLQTDLAEGSGVFDSLRVP